GRGKSRTLFNYRQERIRATATASTSTSTTTTNRRLTKIGVASRYRVTVKCHCIDALLHRRRGCLVDSREASAGRIIRLDASARDWTARVDPKCVKGRQWHWPRIDL